MQDIPKSESHETPRLRDQPFPMVCEKYGIKGIHMKLLSGAMLHGVVQLEIVQDDGLLVESTFHECAMAATLSVNGFHAIA